MAHVVFLRGVNVGGAKAFKPSELAAELEGLDVLSVGAAGTFVVRGRGSAASLATRFREALPFEADVMVVPGEDVSALARREPFAGLPEGEKPFVSVLERRPARLPAFPLDLPEAGDWEVRVREVDGVFALVLRRVAGGKLYPNEVVEKRLGVRATTRAWSTFETLARKLGAA